MINEISLNKRGERGLNEQCYEDGVRCAVTILEEITHVEEKSKCLIEHFIRIFKEEDEPCGFSFDSTSWNKGLYDTLLAVVDIQEMVNQIKAEHDFKAYMRKFNKQYDINRLYKLMGEK